jgi:predicted nucleic acid-binding protein
MTKFIFDACSLIYLTKVNIKEKLTKLGEVIVSQTVKNELIEEIDQFEDAKILNRNIENNKIRESSYKLKNYFTTKNLGQGEKDTIEICLKDEGVPVTDDHKALNLALSMGLKPKTSEVILLDLLKKSVIDYKKFTKSFDELALIKALKPEVVKFIYKKAKEIIKNNIKNSKEEIK